jgi:hypothetical protein
VLNFGGRTLFNTSVAEIAGKKWKHSRRFKSNAELTYSKEYVYKIYRLIAKFNCLIYSLRNVYVLQLFSKTWKHSRRFKSFAEQTYSSKGVGVQGVCFNHVMYVLFLLISYEITVPESKLHYDWRFTANQCVLAADLLRTTT